MARARRHILPFFIPHLGCPQQCVFCDQHKIAGRLRPPTAAELKTALAGLPEGLQPELAFYGGSFTALERAQQVYYLEVARGAYERGKICGIRVSTRPDAVGEGALALLREYGVGTVELGVQSMSDEVLARAKRGHRAADSLAAVRTLRGHGFCTGVQLMPGLPGETLASAAAGAERILAERPDLVRIYPTVVLQGTELGELYEQGEYAPLTLAEAVKISLYVKLAAEERGARVIRIGLQPTEALGEQVLAGPYHPAFGELVLGAYMRCKVMYLLTDIAGGAADNTGVLYCHNSEVSAVVGQKRQNMAYYQEAWPGLRVKATRDMIDINRGELRLEAGGRGWRLTEADFRQNWRRSPYLHID